MKYRWKVLPVDQREAIKAYCVNVIVKCVSCVFCFLRGGGGEREREREREKEKILPAGQRDAIKACIVEVITQTRTHLSSYTGILGDI